MTLPSHVDVAIIGAGAAGLGAAHALQGKQLSVLVLEARERLGGRGHTRQLSDRVIFDVGCGWLHSAERNSFVPIAETLGLALNKHRPPWKEQTFDIGFPQHERHEFFQALHEFYERLEAAADEDDRPASDFLEPGNRWNMQIDAVSTYINGCELDQASVHDIDAYEETDLNWRVVKGYGTLISAYGASCDIALNTKVTLIDHSGTQLRIETSRGTLSAGRVIVTVPTNLIASEAIRFVPALADKVAAAAGLPLGLADKVMLALDDRGDLPADGNLRGRAGTAATGAYHLRPQAMPCIEGYFGGRHARELEDAGDGALAQAAIDEIAGMLGNDFRKRLTPLASSRWAHDEFARGSYSHALPGHAGDRAILAAPLDGRIFFAGEATSPHFFSTAHGARDSGDRAAREVLAVLAKA
ncbi:MAG: FAD-dependent oxidoreductase [Xanthobacteraceae bacterium]|nr:FAD-dependent oxidoreductase [Xanthobacteraceae bacterium]